MADARRTHAHQHIAIANLGHRDVVQLNRLPGRHKAQRFHYFSSLYIA
jgi:hypothetical protein